ncbi:MAG: transcription antitermination factor NusB [Acetobacteraceae bacterium]|nr:MAG: transcription antitermination factor NusB [Acetobacteraceae bacterium]
MRRQGRICALQILYQMDIGKHFDAASAPEPEAVSDLLDMFWRSFEPVDPLERQFAERLVRGVARDTAALDAQVSKVSHNWKIARMAKVDRALLRLATFEILRCPDIPAAVSINEALEIAKRFSGVEAAPFINGILDQLAQLPAEPVEPVEVTAPAANVVPLARHLDRRR